MTALYSYYLAAGTISKATLTGSASNNIENYPMQSDQTSPIMGWHEPQRKNTKRPRPARIATMADLSRSADGFWRFAWSFGVFTKGQLSYMESTFFSSGTAWSAPCTVQTYTDNGTYVCYNATIYRPIPDEDYTIQDDTYFDIIFRFDGGVIIT